MHELSSRNLGTAVEPSPNVCPHNSYLNRPANFRFPHCCELLQSEDSQDGAGLLLAAKDPGPDRHHRHRRSVAGAGKCGQPGRCHAKHKLQVGEYLWVDFFFMGEIL